MAIFPSQRDLFDVPADVAYFNAAYYGPQLRETTRRTVEAVRAKEHPWERTAPDFFTDAERIRELASRALGGDADGWAILPAASYGLSAAARAIAPRLRPGDRVLVIAEDFPSLVLPWRRLAKDGAVEVATVPTPADGDWTAAILPLVDERVRVVAVSSCHWTNGGAVDMRRVGVACRAVGSALVVDATQSLGAVPFPLAEADPDFLVAAGYKWMLCPYGFALAYVAPRWRDARALEEGWLGREGAEDFVNLVRYNDAYRPGARRFDGGQTATAILPGVIAALEQIESWGVDNVASTLAAVTSRLAERLESLGLVLPPAERRSPHLIGARLPAGRAGRVVGSLREGGVHVSQRGDSLRISPHLHVTADDEARLVTELAAALR